MNMRQAKRKHYAALKPWRRASLWLHQQWLIKARAEGYFDDLDDDPCEDDDYNDAFTCDRCHGDGRDPWTDYLLPCPACQGEQH
jgi:hypothetical protein